MQPFDVVIIGSGAAGLLCGQILSREGLNVCILEKQWQTGGNLRTFVRNGREFETGVHYVGSLNPGQPLYHYWKGIGILGRLSLTRMNPDCVDLVCFDDREFPLAQGFGNFTARLLPHFPDAGDRLEKYLDELHSIANLFPLYALKNHGHQGELKYRSTCAMDMFEHYGGDIAALGQTIFCRGQTIHRQRSVSLAKVLAGNGFLYAGTPYTPAHVPALVNHSFISGAFRFTNGSKELISVLCQDISVNGGTIRTGAEVTAINTGSEGFTIQTKTGESFLAKRVVAGIHPAAALDLFRESSVRPVFRARISSLKNTVSAFILFISLKPGTFRWLDHNTYYHDSTDVWSETEAAGAAWPVMYLMVTGKKNPGSEYADTVTILTYMQSDETSLWDKTVHGNRGKDYEDFKTERTARLLRLVYLKFPELASAIDDVTSSTPLTYRDYTGTPGGSLYGIQRDFRDPLLTNLSPKTPIPGFYFTGQNTNLHGIMGVTAGAVKTCGEIIGLDYLLKKISHAQ